MADHRLVAAGEESDPFDSEQARRSLVTHFALERIAGESLDAETSERALKAIRSLPEQAGRTTRQARFAGAALHVFSGLDAARYHADRLALIERELLQAMHDHYEWMGELSDHTVSARVPRLDHEYIAFLNAGRRTLEYVSRSVGHGFGIRTGSIRKLAKGVSDLAPVGVSKAVADACGRLTDDFAELVSREEKRSARDIAAHHTHVEPAWLSVFVVHGQVYIELTGAEPGPMRDPDPDGTISLARMRTDPNLLSRPVNAAFDRLVDLSTELLDLGAEAASSWPHGSDRSRG